MNDEVSSNAEPEPQPPAVEAPAAPPLAEPPPPQAVPPAGPQRTITPPARNGRSWLWVLIPTSCLVGCLPWIILLGLMMGAIIAIGGEEEPQSTHIALIHVTGTITGGSSGSGFLEGTSAGSEDIIAELDRARKSRRAKAIVIRINSPGGSTAGSEEIYNAIMRVRKSGKRVYASMGDVAASGGYYIASACDTIYANSGTITGSIGVIYSGADMSQLYQKIGFRPEIVKSGKFKD